MLILYYAPGTIALATHIALIDAGAEFEARKINFATTEQQSADFLKINPKGRVPALVTNDGVITETPALLTYVAQTHPGANLAPLDDAFAFAQVQSVNNYICSTLHVNHAHRMRGSRWTDDAEAIKTMQAKVPQTVRESFAYLEETSIKGPYVMGDTYTIADPYLHTVSQWAEGDGVDLAEFPLISAHYATMQKRHSVIEALKQQGIS